MDQAQSPSLENTLPPMEMAKDSPPFFQVSVFKLVVMSLCTFGLYELYWFYKNWELIRQREGVNISPFARAFFSPIFCYEAFCRIRDYPVAEDANRHLAAGSLAMGWIVAFLIGKLPNPLYSLLGLLMTIMFLTPVQIAAQSINTVVAPNSDANSQFGLWNWLAVAIGGFMIVCAFITEN